MARSTLRNRTGSVPKHAPAHSQRNKTQKKWLAERFPTFLTHQLNGTLLQFFSPLYEEYFAVWPPVPTAETIAQKDGDVAKATAAVRGIEQKRLYRWFHNRTRSKHGVKGKGSGSSKGVNLTGGPPKLKAPLQAYVKYYWESKVKQAVIDRWAPTPETDLFRQIDNGEDQVAWEVMTPMEKNIPLWFRMQVGRELFEAESKEVKDEVDRRRLEEKEGVTSALGTMFKTDEERLVVMGRYNENFSKLNNALANLCKNIYRDFGFHTTVMVGGPVISDGGRLGTFVFETPGTVQQELTYSDFCGNPHETENELKFLEYLKLCFPKDVRRLYTLDPVSADIESVAQQSLPEATSAAAAPPPPGIVTTPIEDDAVLAAQDASIVTAQSDISPRPTAKEANGPMSDANDVGMDDSVAHTENETMAVDPTEIAVGENRTATPIRVTPPANRIPGVTESESMAVDPAGTTADEDQTTTPAPPVNQLAGVQVSTNERLGLKYLIETPPTLLSEDEDVRPEWLMGAVKTFLCRFVPYFGNLGKVVDLFLAQEARLGYPKLSSRLPLPSYNRPTEVARFMKCHRDYSRGENLDEEKFGEAVLQWWITIQPTSRKTWPPVYDAPLPQEFSFNYFNHGGPNGVFLMVLCLGWWANALTPETDFTKFDLVVNDVTWVLQQIAIADQA